MKYLRSARLRWARFMLHQRLAMFDRKIYVIGYNRAGRTLYLNQLQGVKIGNPVLQKELDEIYRKFDAVVSRK